MSVKDELVISELSQPHLGFKIGAKEIKEFLNKPNTTPLMASAEYARQKNKIAKDCWSRFCQIDQMWFLKMVEAHNLY